MHTSLARRATVIAAFAGAAAVLGTSTAMADSGTDPFSYADGGYPLATSPLSAGNIGLTRAGTGFQVSKDLMNSVQSEETAVVGAVHGVGELTSI